MNGEKRAEREGRETALNDKIGDKTALQGDIDAKITDIESIEEEKTGAQDGNDQGVKDEIQGRLDAANGEKDTLDG